MIYVDKVQCWPTAIRCFKTGSCHMWADTPEELHAMAARIGLRRGWFQADRRLPHYDLTPARRAKAIVNGAQESSVKAFFSHARAAERMLRKAGS